MTKTQIHPEIIQRFLKLRQNNRLAHAYLFLGPLQVGKIDTALEISKLLNCESSPSSHACQECPPCLKIAHGNHPDIHILDTEPDETIKIEQIRALIGRIHLRSFEARWKVFILKNVERLTIESANALLKTLEEPSPETLMILTSSIPEEIPDTIRSRCHVVHFFSGSYKKLARVLIDDYAVSQPEARFLAYYAQGCLGRAIQLKDQKISEGVPQVLSSILFSSDGDKYFKEILSDAQKTKETLNILLFWFRDLMVLKTSGAVDGLIYEEHLKDLKCHESRYSFEELDDLIRQIVKTLELLGENLNVKIAFSLVKEKLCRK